MGAMDAAGYFLTTERLGFRPWREDDLPLAQNLWGDPRVTKFIGGPFSEAQVHERLSLHIAMQNDHGVQYWPIFRRSDHAHVGCCGLRPYRLEDGVFEMGFHLCFDFWGAGYASEAGRAVVRHAFRDRGVTALFAGHHPQNAQSGHVLGKLGFRYLHDEFHAPTGLMHPSYLLTAADPPATT